MTLTGTVAAPVELDGEALEASGARIEVPCVDVIELQDGLIASKHSYLDAAAFQAQMGVS
jgi:ketosteroid isomerase-like protein